MLLVGMVPNEDEVSLDELLVRREAESVADLLAGSEGIVPVYEG